MRGRAGAGRALAVVVAACACVLLAACVAQEDPPTADRGAPAGAAAPAAAGAAAADAGAADAAGAATDRSDAEVLALLRRVPCWDGDPARVAACLPPEGRALDAIEEMGRSRDARFLAPLLDLLQVDVGWEPEVRAALRALTGQRMGDAAAWFDWYAGQPPAPPVPGYATWKAALLDVLAPPTAVTIADLLDGRVDRPDLLWWEGRAPAGRPPLVDPQAVHRLEEGYLAPGDRVYGVVIGGEARAYPHRIVSWHGAVNDVVGGRAVVLAVCPPCGGARAFAAQEGGARLTFADSGLAGGGRTLLYDRERLRLWDALGGVARSAAGADGAPGALDPLPVATTTWAEWSGRFPNTTVLALDTGFVRDYDAGAGDRAAGPLAPGAPVDPRLPAGEPVVGVTGTRAAHAWPRARLEAAGVTRAAVDGGEVLFVSAGPGTGVHVYPGAALGAARVEGGGADLRLVDGAGERWFVQPGALVSTVDGREIAARPSVEVSWEAWVSLAASLGLPVVPETGGG